jgi:hypothetical protein
VRRPGGLPWKSLQTLQRKERVPKRREIWRVAKWDVAGRLGRLFAASCPRMRTRTRARGLKPERSVPSVPTA